MNLNNSTQESFMPKDNTQSDNSQQDAEINLNPSAGIHHSFDIKLAEIYGIQEAILIHHFQHWIRINKKLNRNNHDGSCWTYQSLDEIAAHFPYWSRGEVFEIIERLCTGKGRRSKKVDLLYEPVLKKGNFNATKYDRTIWYAFIDEEKWGLGKPKCILAEAKMEVGSSQNGNWSEPTPIPDTIPDTKKSLSKERDRDSPSLKIDFGELKTVKLTQIEYDKLILKLGESKTLLLINDLDLYLAQKGDKYKSHYATILKWSQDDSRFQENEFKLAKHREGSKLAFETKKDEWKPKTRKLISEEVI